MRLSPCRDGVENSGKSGKWANCGLAEIDMPGTFLLDEEQQSLREKQWARRAKSMFSIKGEGCK